MRTEPGAVPALARRAVDLVTTALMYLDDSSGVVGDDLHQLMAVHARACALAPPEPKRLARWLAKLRLDGPGWPDFQLRDYQTALGHNGRVELARIVDERVATAEPDVSGRAPFGVRILREQLAEISGDLDHYVAVLAENLDSAGQYLQIVRALRSGGRVAEAEQWAQRGLGLGNPIDQGKLTDAYEDLLLERDAADEALALRWGLFEQNPTAAHYVALRRTAGRIGEWNGLREDALARMRRAAARQPAFANELVAALLDDEAWEQAWQEGLEHHEDLPTSRWHRLIELRQPTHPADVIEPWQRLIQQRLQASQDKYRYSKVITMLGKLRDAYRACGNPDGFATYLDQLRTQHQRKTSLLAKLDRAHL